MNIKYIKKVQVMIEIMKCIVEKLNAWQILLVILTILILIGAVVFFVLVNRIHIKLYGILEINSKKNTINCPEK